MSTPFEPDDAAMAEAVKSVGNQYRPGLHAEELAARRHRRTVRRAVASGSVLAAIITAGGIAIALANGTPTGTRGAAAGPPVAATAATTQQSSPSGPSASDTVPAPTSTTASAATSAASSTAAPAPAPACTGHQLDITRARLVLVTMGGSGVDLLFANHSDRPCSLTGYPDIGFEDSNGPFTEQLHYVHRSAQWIYNGDLVTLAPGCHAISSLFVNTPRTGTCTAPFTYLVTAPGTTTQLAVPSEGNNTIGICAQYSTNVWVSPLHQ